VSDSHQFNTTNAILFLLAIAEVGLGKDLGRFMHSQLVVVVIVSPTHCLDWGVLSRLLVYVCDWVESAKVSLKKKQKCLFLVESNGSFGRGNLFFVKLLLQARFLLQIAR
jgi:hypothetical protein